MCPREGNHLSCSKKCNKKMNILIILLLGFHGAEAVLHSLSYGYTASSGIPDFPEFVTIGIVDGQPVSYYDSIIREEIPKQDWMKQTEGPEYWDMQTKISVQAEKGFKVSIENVRRRLNQTKGVHIVQKMYGCKWDDETDRVSGFNQFGYDGEDFLTFDLKTQTWIAPKQQALLTKMKWDRDQLKFKLDKQYLTHECIGWLKQYIDNGRKSLMRTDRPTVSFLQKSPTAPVTCHATGFYPNRAAMHWKKDGVEIHDNVVMGEILPNNDGTFQMSIDLSSVKLDDKTKYECVFQLSGVDDITHELRKEVIKSNEKTATFAIIIVVAVAVLCAMIIAGVGFFIYKKKNVKRRPSPVSDPEVEQELNPKV
uniref:Major histocompatibility complex class I-related gene protein-like n=1 Tax=Sphaeramia orbicularis TaxID=375764 RepID=A0A672YRB6_9TELE